MIRLCFALMLLLAASTVIRAEEPDVKTQVAKVLTAAGGEEKLLKLFRIHEKLVVNADPNAKATTRISVLEPPKYWWLGKKERVREEKEPATFLVWAWTLGILTDAKSKIATLAEVEVAGVKSYGLQVSETVTPAMDLYFDEKTHRLTHIDWRSDRHSFSDWKEHDGASYPAKTIGTKKASGKAWYFSEITKLERLAELPKEYKREPN